MKTAKRSQFFGVLYDVDLLHGQLVVGSSAPVCHMASFCRNWLRLRVRCPSGYEKRVELPRSEVVRHRIVVKDTPQGAGKCWFAVVTPIQTAVVR
jgi:hypothetical protein